VLGDYFTSIAWPAYLRYGKPCIDAAAQTLASRGVPVLRCSVDQADSASEIAEAVRLHMASPVGGDQGNERSGEGASDGLP